MAQTVYCTREDVYFVLREEGARNHAEDDLLQARDWNTVSEAHVDRAIQFASATIFRYLGERYTPADLSNAAYEGKHIVQCACAVLAACDLASRSGNQPAAGLKDWCEKTEGWLKQVQARHLTIPGMPEASRSVPTVENYRIVPGAWRPIRHRTNSSTGPQSSQPRLQDWRDVYAAGSYYGVW